MLTIDKIEGTDIYEFSIKGDIDENSVKDFYDLLAVKSQENQQIKLLGTINDFPGFEDFKAFSATMKMKYKAISNISKYAVLSDKDWINAILPVGNFVTPGIPMKHFDLGERDNAIAWLKKDEQKEFSEDHYLSKMNVENIRGTNIYKFTIDGKIDEAGMTALYTILKDKTREGKINLIAYFKNFDGFENFKSFIEGMKLDFAVFGNLDKYAIITDKKWIKKVADIESKLIPGITMKGFKEDKEAKALSWLKE
tara:strand:+ start:3742 stop:4500 length:759 start_codon:yes stop_codon:yes gene_type:complete